MGSANWFSQWDSFREMSSTWSMEKQSQRSHWGFSGNTWGNSWNSSLADVTGNTCASVLKSSLLMGAKEW
jgi:hypothetical protein